MTVITALYNTRPAGPENIKSIGLFPFNDYGSPEWHMCLLKAIHDDFFYFRWK